MSSSSPHATVRILELSVLFHALYRQSPVDAVLMCQKSNSFTFDRSLVDIGYDEPLEAAIYSLEPNNGGSALEMSLRTGVRV